MATENAMDTIDEKDLLLKTADTVGGLSKAGQLLFS